MPHPSHPTGSSVASGKDAKNAAAKQPKPPQAVQDVVDEVLDDVRKIKKGAKRRHRRVVRQARRAYSPTQREPLKADVDSSVLDKAADAYDWLGGVVKPGGQTPDEMQEQTGLSGVDVATMIVPLPFGKLKALGMILRGGKAADKATDVGRIARAVEDSGQGKKAIREVEKAVAKREAASGAKREVDEVAETVTKKVKRIERKAARKSEREAAKSERKLDKAIRDEGKGAKERVKEGAGRQWKKRQPAPLTKEGRKMTAYRKIEGIQRAAPVAAPVVAGVGAGVASSTGQALLDDPKKVLDTTVRAVPGLATAPIGIAADVGETVKNVAEGNDDPFAPLKGQAKQQMGYWKDYATLAQGGDEAQDLIENKYGLVPALTGALTVSALSRPFRAVPEAREPLRVRRLRHKAETAPRRADRQDALDDLRGRERLRDAHDNRKEVAEDYDAAGERARSQFDEAMKTTPEGAKRRHRFDKTFRRLQKKRLGDDLSLADAVQLVGREGIPLNPERGLPRLERIRDELEPLTPDKDIDPNTIATREVVEALIANPRLLADPDLGALLASLREIGFDFSQRRHRSRGEDVEGIDPLDERARLMHVARREDIPLPEERIPDSLEGLVRHTPERGVNARRAITDEATADVRRAGRVRRKAKDAYRDTAERQRRDVETERREIAILERRAAVLREDVRGRERELRRRINRNYKTKPARARAWEAARRGDSTLNRRRMELVETEAAVRELRIHRATGRRDFVAERRAAADRVRAEVDEIRTAAERKRFLARLDREASKLERAGDLEGAQALIREFRQTEDRTLGRFTDETEGRIREEGLEEPIFFPERDASDVGALNVQRDFPGGKIPPGEKMRKGTLAEQGRIDESAKGMLEGLHRRYVAHEMSRLTRDFVDKFSDGTVRSGAEWRRAEQRGEVSSDSVLMPVQEFERAFQRQKWGDESDDAWSGLDKAMGDAIHRAKLDPGKKYVAVPKSALQEFRAQMQPLNKVAKGFRALARVQSIALLGLSPAWFAYQTIASPLALAMSHSNPAKWGKAMTQMATSYRKIPKRVRRDFEAVFGGTSGDIQALNNVEFGIHPQTVRTMRNAARVAQGTWAGRMLEGLKRGGPLIAANRRYEAKVRTLGALMAIDKLHNQGPARRMIESISALDQATRRDIAHLDGLPLAEQVRWYADHPRHMKEIQRLVNDALGDWTALSRREKNASSVMLFYPFLRFSLRWTFNAFPKNHGLKAAVLLNLAQANSDEVDKLLGGAPSFFSGYGMVPVHSGPEGKAEIALNLARIAPGSNALIEAIGSGDVNLATAGRVLQPLVTIPATQGLAGFDPFTGEQTADTLRERAALVASQILALAPPARALDAPDKVESAITGQEMSRAGDFFRSFDDKPDWQRALIPDPTLSFGVERAKAQAGRLLEKEEPDSDQINALVKKLVDKGLPPNEYGIKNDPDLRALVKQAREHDRSSDEFSDWMKAQGFGETPEEEAMFGAVWSLLNPYKGRWQYRSEADKRRYRRKRGGATGSSSGGWTDSSSTDWGDSSSGSTDWSDSSTDWGN